MSATRIIARANKMFTRSAAIAAKAQKLLATVSDDGAPVVKATRTPKAAPVKAVSKKVLKATPAKKVRRSVEVEEAPVRKTRVAKVAAAPVKKTRTAKVVEAPAKKAPAKKVKSVDVEEIKSSKAPKNVKFQVEDDFPSL